MSSAAMQKLAQLRQDPDNRNDCRSIVAKAVLLERE
jgi:hypothetical protein